MNETRTRNASTTRQAIMDSARRHFIKDGYDNAGLRAIAADAGIDAALICRYFGSKKQLFADVLASTSKKDLMEVFHGNKATCGERVAHALLTPSEDKDRSMRFVSLVTGAAASPEASMMAQQHIMKEFIQPFSDWLGGERADEKAWLVSSLLLGAVIMNNISPACTVSCAGLAQQIQSIIDQ